LDSFGYNKNKALLHQRGEYLNSENAAKSIDAAIAVTQSQYAHQAKALPFRPIFVRSKKDTGFLLRAITATYRPIAPANAVIARIRKMAAMVVEAFAALQRAAST
jgi:hypothetical protein